MGHFPLLRHPLHAGALRGVVVLGGCSADCGVYGGRAPGRPRGRPEFDFRGLDDPGGCHAVYLHPGGAGRGTAGRGGGEETRDSRCAGHRPGLPPRRGPRRCLPVPAERAIHPGPAHQAASSGPPSDLLRAGVRGGHHPERDVLSHAGAGAAERVYRSVLGELLRYHAARGVLVGLAGGAGGARDLLWDGGRELAGARNFCGGAAEDRCGGGD
mmetsp:Transcript_44782/g.97375  ORF Transcript_44782/g.97375 Transcript_44782/m.97375 type:complete len:213 (+) Transcript_44782:719-1357(+)